jgi:hypothetical protein
MGEGMTVRNPMTWMLLALLSPALAACGGASSGSSEGQLLVPADVEFPWNDAYNEPYDGRAAIVPLDVMVYDGLTGEPVAGVDVELSSDEAEFVDADEVLRADGDAGCDACVWDAYRDEYVELPADLAFGGRELGLAGRDTGRGALIVTTDAAGLVRAHAVVDALPVARGAFAPVAVRVRIDGDEATLRLEPR